jgi:3-hydroxy-9,10-secoandrosta-1,3,5(10)-triene-9,17-dione monooxygenase
MSGRRSVPDFLVLRQSEGKVVDGGFPPRWPMELFSETGICKWAFLGAVVPHKRLSVWPNYRTFLVPISDYKIEDSWDVVGLQGTGSHDGGERCVCPQCHKSIDGFSV